MANSSFSTQSLAPTHQFEAWRDWFWPVFTNSPFSNTPQDDPAAGFVASNKVWKLGSIVVSSVSAPALTSTRDKANIRKAPVDHWVIAYCRSSATLMQTDSGLIDAPPGVPYIWSLADKSVNRRTKVDRIQIMIPRDAFHDVSALLDVACGTALDNPLGRVLGEYMLALEKWLPAATDEAMPRMGNAIHSMVAACVTPSKKRVVAAGEEFARVRAVRVRQAIREHLTSPTLRPEMLCQTVGVSRSDLYRMFENCGGVMRYIQRQRLIQAYSLLSDPRNRKSILAISDEFCFADASSFSRAFRQEFGCSPSDIRAGSGSERLADVVGPDTACFDDLLHK